MFFKDAKTAAEMPLPLLLTYMHGTDDRYMYKCDARRGSRGRRWEKRLGEVDRSGKMLYDRVSGAISNV